MEFRIKDCQLQADDSGQLRVGGYVNVTERESEMLYNKKSGKWFKEIMKKGVFQRAIERAGRNIPLLFEHDWNKQLASIEEGSLTLREDNVGLRFDAVIEDENIYHQVRAGLINSCSFGFRALAEEVEGINTRLERRFVNAIELLEVSLVKNPAYVGSLCETRSYEEELNEEKVETEIVSDEERAECGTKEKREEESLEEEIKEEEAEGKLEGDSEEEIAQEVSEEIEEESEEERANEALVEKAEETEESKEESEQRFDEGEVALTEAQPRLDREYLAGIVEELIEAKLQEVKKAEELEDVLTDEVQIAKEFHQDVERELENNTITQGHEVLRLRLQLLKLKEIKEGMF